MINESEVRRMVSATVNRLLGGRPSPTSDSVTLRKSRKRLIYQDDVRAVPIGGELSIARSARLSPLAQELALQRRIRITTAASPIVGSFDGVRTVALGADHGGFALKESLKKQLEEASFRVTDVGTHSVDAVDYPDFAFAVAKLVADGQAWRGIMVDGAGIGSCMVANKVPGVRAALCYDLSSAINSREHNDANVLTLGGSLIGLSLAQQIVKSWLATEFGGGRHARRVNKISDVEQRFARR